jgi:diguanylate cyclase (GGDEF)-like protein
MKKSGISKEEVADLRWDTISLAVHSVAEWLIGDVPLDPSHRDRFASLGNAAARQREVGTSSARVDNPPDAVPIPKDHPDFKLSIVMITRLNLWWSEATRRVLAEEASRLKISRATLDEACDAVVKSCSASSVSMAKRYDAEIQSLHERLTHLALHDSLTGLVNRTMLTDWLDRALARLARHPEGLVVAFMDLDNFKEVNDFFGHACGDDVLVELASRLTAQMRPEDVVARFGGDEFVAVFGHLSQPWEAAQVIAERLRSIMTEPLKVKGEKIHMTISIGIAVVRGPGYLSDEVLARADEAMYSIKRTGRNKIVIMEGSPTSLSLSTIRPAS